MLRKIRLYGPLAEFVGHRELEAKADTVGEAVRFLLCNWPALDQHMAEQYYKVEIGNWNVALDEVNYPSGAETIRIIPVVEGAGGRAGSIGAILLGAALIGVALSTSGVSLTLAGFTAGKAAAAGITAAAAAGNIGISLVLGGVAMLLTPTPQTPTADSDNSERPNNVFSGVQQTTQAGTTIPVIYGEVITGSVVISSRTIVNLDEGSED